MTGINKTGQLKKSVKKRLYSLHAFSNLYLSIETTHTNYLEIHIMTFYMTEAEENALNQIDFEVFETIFGESENNACTETESV